MYLATTTGGKNELMEPNTRGRLVDAKTIGAQLGLKDSPVYEMAQRGLLPTVKFGRRVLFPVDAVDRLAEVAIARAVSAASAPTASPSR